MLKTDRDKLLARIRKLYAMGLESESSPHEADIAMRRCQSLMAKFGITEADLETSEFGASTLERQFRALPRYVSVLASSVALLHDCICVRHRSMDCQTIEFRGFSIDADVASLTFAYLSESIERSLKARKREGRVPPGRSASFDYRVGFALAVLERVHRIDQERRQAEAERLREATAKGEATGTNLVLVKRELVDKHCLDGVTEGRPQRVSYRDSQAHAAGTQDGTQVSLERQVGRERQRRLGVV